MSFWSTVKNIGGVVGSKALDVGVSALANGINNDMSFDMWKKQQDYLDEMNSPKRQVARLAEAGLNPALLSGNVSTTGMAQSTQAASQVSDPANAYAQLQNKRAIDIQERQAEAQVNNVNEDTKGKQIDNQTKLQANIADINEKLADIELKKKQATTEDTKQELNRQEKAYKEQLTELQKQLTPEQVREQTAKADTQEGEAKVMEEKGKQEEIITKNLPKQLETALAEARSRIADNYAGAEQKKANAALSKAQEVLTKIQSYSASIDLNTKQRLSRLTEDALRAKTLAELENSINELRREKNRQDLPQKFTEYIGELIDGVIPLRHLFK